MWKFCSFYSSIETSVSQGKPDQGPRPRHITTEVNRPDFKCQEKHNDKKSVFILKNTAL